MSEVPEADAIELYRINPKTERAIKNYFVREDGCWEYRGRKNKQGYAVAYNKFLHREAFVRKTGYPLKVREPLDHKCHDPKTCRGGKTCPHRPCINPDHVEPTTNEVNSSADRSCRSKHHLPVPRCKYGHDLDAVNTYWQGNARQCRRCMRLRHIARQAARGLHVSRYTKMAVFDALDSPGIIYKDKKPKYVAKYKGRGRPRK